VVFVILKFVSLHFVVTNFGMELKNHKPTSVENKENLKFWGMGSMARTA
jgi:hypothetical protein